MELIDLSNEQLVSYFTRQTLSEKFNDNDIVVIEAFVRIERCEGK